METVPHDNRPQVLLRLKFLENSGHFLASRVVVICNFLQPYLSPMEISVDFLANTVIVESDPMKHMFSFSYEPLLKIPMQIMTRFDLADLCRFILTI